MILDRARFHRRDTTSWCANALLAGVSLVAAAFDSTAQTHAAGVTPLVIATGRDHGSASSFDGAAVVEASAFEIPAEAIVYEGISGGSYAEDGMPCHTCRQADPCGDPCVCDRDPPGLFQQLHAHHTKSNACWVGRADGLLLWRDAPPTRPLVVTGDGAGTVLLGADQLESTATGGVRGSILRVDGCSGDAWELGYIFAGTFTGRRVLPFLPDDPAAYALAEPGIYGENASQPFSSGTASLLARLQSAELNRHLASGPNLRWLAGFRWLQWQEQVTLVDNLDDGLNLIDDFYSTDCVNNLYGGQIGVDARLLTIGWLRVESLVKAGAYYNEASQTSVYSITDFNDPGNSGTESVSVARSPAGCSFVGEVGMTGVVPICSNWDFRVGYLALWLTGLAQPTQQLSGQQLPIGGPAVGSLMANGGTLLQGLTLGLEGRW